MTFSDQFQTDGVGIAPQPWMQLRPVGSVTQLGVSRSYSPTDGLAKNDALQAIQVGWRNDTPTKQWVYGIVTMAGARVALQARSRGYISQAHGAAVTDPGTDPGTLQSIIAEVSRFGVGANIGASGLLSANTGFCVPELNENSNSVYLTPAHVGWYLVAPGQTFTGRVETRFISDFWESTTIDGGDTGTESSVLAGDIELALFACPTVADPPPRSTPLIVGGPANVTFAQNIDYGIGTVTMSPALPSGLQVGDILVAVVVNNAGGDTDVNPVQPGWTQAQERDGGSYDVHFRMYMRTITTLTGLPAKYDFTNGLLAEGTAVLFALRNTVTFDGSDGGSGWYISSGMTTWTLAAATGKQTAPSINRGGQLLVALSYLTHQQAIAPVHQTVPDGMTKLIEVPGQFGTLELATLANPPMPTGDKVFTASQIPSFFTGHTITASLLVPGISTL